VPDRAFIKPLPYSWEHRVVGPLRSWHGRRGDHGRLESGLDDEPTKDTGEPIGKALPYALYFCIIHHNEILPGRTTDALSPTPRLVFFGSLPSWYVLLCLPLGFVAVRGVRMRNWCVFLARIISGDQYFEGFCFSHSSFGCSFSAFTPSPSCIIYTTRCLTS